MSILRYTAEREVEATSLRCPLTDPISLQLGVPDRVERHFLWRQLVPVCTAPQELPHKPRRCGSCEGINVVLEHGLPYHAGVWDAGTIPSFTRHCVLSGNGGSSEATS